MRGTDDDSNGRRPGHSGREDGGPRTLQVFIGKGVKFQGTLVHNGTIRIDGAMEGEVRTEGCLLIGEQAVVTATVVAGTLICKGRVMGHVVVSKKADFQSPAVLIGSVTTPMLSIAEGVRMKGDVRMNRSSQPAFMRAHHGNAPESVSAGTPEA